ncbi:MAG: hypothetical protein ACR2IE_14045 [Candidatus Sumerlaeaceae bacterium]
MELDKLEQLCAQRRLVHLERPLIDEGADVKGYLLEAGDEWILVNEVSDFHLNGHCAIRRADVESVRRGRYERILEAILRKEGVRAAAQLTFPLRLDSTQDMFADLVGVEQNMILEGEIEDSEFFYIGRLVRVGKKSLSIHHFDASGRWDQIPSLVSFDNITRVTFGSEYIRIFSKYTR